MSRTALRASLLRQRRKLGRNGYRPFCEYCELEINHATGCEMHEVIITRGEAVGWGKDERALIMAPENCVLLHPEPCHRPLAKHKAVRDFLTRKLLERHGAEQIICWLESLPAGTLIEQKKHYIMQFGEQS